MTETYADRPGSGFSSEIETGENRKHVINNTASDAARGRYGSTGRNVLAELDVYSVAGEVTDKLDFGSVAGYKPFVGIKGVVMPNHIGAQHIG